MKDWEMTRRDAFGTSKHENHTAVQNYVQNVLRKVNSFFKHCADNSWMI